MVKRRPLVTLWRLLSAHPWTMGAALGLALVAAGLAWLCHPSLGLIVPGLAILSLSVYGARAHGSPQRPV